MFPEADFTLVEPESSLFSRLNDRTSIGRESPKTVVVDAEHHSRSEHRRAIVHGRWLYRNVRRPNAKMNTMTRYAHSKALKAIPKALGILHGRQISFPSLFGRFIKRSSSFEGGTSANVLIDPVHRRHSSSEDAPKPER